MRNLSFTFVTARCEHHIELSWIPSGRDVAFVFPFAHCKLALNVYTVSSSGCERV